MSDNLADFELDNAKGTVDFSGFDAILRNRVRAILQNVFERYGYNPLETPGLERWDVLAAKGGDEINREVYRLKDQGDRELGLRFDQTVPLARYVAMHPHIALPFKRYEMGPVFRDGPTQPEQGRYRVFTQCDVDVVGIQGMGAEAEIIALSSDVFSELGLGDLDVRVSNRKILDGILDYAEVPPGARTGVVTALDKLEKIGIDGVAQELEGNGISEEPKYLSPSTVDLIVSAGSVNGLEGQIKGEVGVYGLNGVGEILQESPSGEELRRQLNLFETKGGVVLTPKQISSVLDVAQLRGTNRELLARLEEFVQSENGRQGIAELGELFDYSDVMSLGEFVRFNPSLARGLAYYTGSIFEVYLKDRQIFKDAITAGGRFDDMIGAYARTQRKFPAVGISFGLERICHVLRTAQIAEEKLTNVQVYIVPVAGTLRECLGIAQDLRAEGINVDLNHTGERLREALGYADSAKIPYALIIGPDELEGGVAKLKDMESQKQMEVPIGQITNYLP